MNSTEVRDGFKAQQLKAMHEKIKKQDIVLADLEAFKSQIETYLTSEEARKHNQESSHINAVKHRLELVEKDIKSQKAAEVDTEAAADRGAAAEAAEAASSVAASIAEETTPTVAEAAEAAAKAAAKAKQEAEEKAKREARKNPSRQPEGEKISGAKPTLKSRLINGAHGLFVKLPLSVVKGAWSSLKYGAGAVLNTGKAAGNFVWQNSAGIAAGMGASLLSVGVGAASSASVAPMLVVTAPMFYVASGVSVLKLAHDKITNSKLYKKLADESRLNDLCQSLDEGVAKNAANKISDAMRKFHQRGGAVGLQSCHHQVVLKKLNKTPYKQSDSYREAVRLESISAERAEQVSSTAKKWAAGLFEASPSSEQQEALEFLKSKGVRLIPSPASPA